MNRLPTMDEIQSFECTNCLAPPGETCEGTHPKMGVHFPPHRERVLAYADANGIDLGEKRDKPVGERNKISEILDPYGLRPSTGTMERVVASTHCWICQAPVGQLCWDTDSGAYAERTHLERIQDSVANRTS